MNEILRLESLVRVCLEETFSTIFQHLKLFSDKNYETIDIYFHLVINRSNETVASCYEGVFKSFRTVCLER